MPVLTAIALKCELCTQFNPRPGITPPSLFPLPTTMDKTNLMDFTDMRERVRGGNSGRLLWMTRGVPHRKVGCHCGDQGLDQSLHPTAWVPYDNQVRQRDPLQKQTFRTS